MRAIRARYNPFLQTRHRVEQVQMPQMNSAVSDNSNYSFPLLSTVPTDDNNYFCIISVEATGPQR